MASILQFVQYDNFYVGAIDGQSDLYSSKIDQKQLGKQKAFNVWVYVCGTMYIAAVACMRKVFVIGFHV